MSQNVVVRRHGATAAMSGTQELRFGAAGPVKAFVSQTWIKRVSGWQQVL